MKRAYKTCDAHRVGVFFYHLIGLLLLLFLARVVYYVYNYSAFSHLTVSELLRVAYGGLLFDGASVAYSNSLYFLLLFSGAFFPARVERSAFWRVPRDVSFLLPASINLFVNIADAGYYPFVLRRTTLSVFREFAQEDKLQLFGRFFVSYWPLTVSGLLLITLLVYGYYRVRVRRKEHETLGEWGWQSLLSLGSMALVLGASLLTIRGTLVMKTTPMTEMRANDFVRQAHDRVLPLNTLFTMIRSSQKRVLEEYSFYDPGELPRYFSPIYTAAPLYKQDSLFGAYAGQNVVIVFLESFAREYIGALNGDGGTPRSKTPFFDSLVERGLTFGHAFANGRESIHAIPSTLMSIPNLDVEFVTSPYAGNRVVGLPEILREEGYETSFFHGADAGSMNFEQLMTQIGVARTYNRTAHREKGDYDGSWGIFDHKFLQTVAGVLSTERKPFFSVLFTLSSHEPYTIPEKYKERFTGSKHPLLDAVAYADMALGQFFDRVSREPWYDETLFVLLADHASVNLRPEYDNVAGRYAIPIVFFDPRGRLKGRQDQLVAQQADIYPSLLYLLGVRRPVVTYGTNLFDPQALHAALEMVDGQFYLFHHAFTIEMTREGRCTVQPSMVPEQRDPGDPDDMPPKEVLEKYERRMKGIVQDYTHRMITNQLTPL